ncbi:MAG: peptidoglycan D,D-transpeptidase FtsI family protein [Gammaproteobacteria bacterium]
MRKLNFFNWRFFIIIVFLILSIAAIFIRVIYLQIDKENFLKNWGQNQHIAYRVLTPVRGTIYDRNKIPLAITLTHYDLYGLRNIDKQDFEKLKNIISFDTSFNQFTLNNKKTLLYESLSPELISRIKKSSINNYEVEMRFSRHYPLGDQIAPLVGFSGKDNFGLEGIEKSYNSFLSGKRGKEKYYKNRKGQIISKAINVEPKEPGQDLYLTIDSNIQFFTYKKLAESVQKSNAKSGSAIVLDNNSGEILAIASYPSYNPNNPNRKIQKNRALLDAYEPGSVLKPIAMASAIDNGLIDIEDAIDTSPGYMSLNNYSISDTKNHGILKSYEIITKSSQVGASKVALMLGSENIIASYKKFGFSKPININFPSSAFGRINNRVNMSDIEIANLGFGYGINASPFQIASAYSVFANEGLFKEFTLIMNDEYKYEEQIISKDTAKKILFALEDVVENGSGYKAKISGFKVGGKTGTAHKSSRTGGYAKSIYTASFAGIVPIDKKDLTIFVSIYEPGLNAYKGGEIAAPLFASIATDTLNYLGYFEDE